MEEQISFFRGFGIEHEVMFFHIPKPIINKSQKIELPPTSVFFPTDHLQYLKQKGNLPIEELEFLNGLPALEQSGRKCANHWILKKAGDNLLVEFANRGWFEESNKPNHTFKRHISHFIENIIEQEIRFREILHKYCSECMNISKVLGYIAPVSVGMLPNIHVRKSVNESIKLRTKLHKDYTGSFHFTITLPFPLRPLFQYTKEETQLFIEMHRNFANYIQWIEPLFCAVFGTPDLSASGPQLKTSKPKPRGSFRVFHLGWGNYAGSDLRKLEKGISRYANIQPYWRQNLQDLEGVKELKKCDFAGLEPGAISAVGSDFRTFGSRDILRPWHRESGLPMIPPNGLEMRFLDHFDPFHLYPLCQMIGFIMEHSRLHHIGNRYVYKNKAWMEAMNVVMRSGWRGRLPDSYISQISDLFGISFGKNRQAYHIFTILQQHLFHTYKDGLWSKIFLGESASYENIKCPNINRNGWELGFLIWLSQHPKKANEWKQWVRSLPKKWNHWDDWTELWNSYSGNQNWGTQDRDMIYLLESIGLYHLKPISGETIQDETFPLELCLQFIDNFYVYLRQSCIIEQYDALYQQMPIEYFEMFSKDRVIKEMFVYKSFNYIIRDRLYLLYHSKSNDVPMDSKRKNKITTNNRKKFKHSQILPEWIKKE